MDDHLPTPFPLIHIDLNHEPSPTHNFFFPNHRDHDHALFPQPQQPRQGNSHHTHGANLDDKFIITQGGRHDHPPHGPDHDYGHDHYHGHPQEYCSVKWMSSKTRIMKKMTSGGKPSAVHNLGSDPNHKGSSTVSPRTWEILEIDRSSSANSNRSYGSEIESNNSPTIIRVCADCNTTKTPLWRSGPTGPKTLCNACGIRQRKARRAMVAAAAAANGEIPPQPNPAPMKLKQKKKKMKKMRSSPSDNDNDDNSGDPQPKKKLKTLHPPVGSSRKLCFEEFVLKLSEWISNFRGVFPQDEKEAAILLMALSYGLVRADKLS